MHTDTNMRMSGIHSLQFKLGLALIFVATIVLSGFGWYQYTTLKTERIDGLTQIADTAIERLAEGLVEPLWNFAETQRDQILITEMREQSIYAIVITNPQGQRVVAKVRDEKWEIISTHDEIPPEGIIRSKEVVRAGEVLGTVELHVSLRVMQQDLNETVRNLAIMILGLDAALYLFFAISLRWFLVTPVKRLLVLANSLSAGNFDLEIAGLKQRDEIGALANAYQQMRETIQNALREMDRLIQAVQQGKLAIRGDERTFQGSWSQLIIGVNRVLDAFTMPLNMMKTSIARISQGDIPSQMSGEYAGDFDTIKNDLNVMIQTLRNFAFRVRAAADQVASGSHELSATAGQMSQGAAKQAATAQEVSATMEEISANIRQNAENAQQTEKIAIKAVEDARASGKTVAQTLQAMREIADKIEVIERIANQTHILSLNATIEAAKAQEYGKGFAVVASEVRLLAERSRLAAEEISDLASSSVVIAETAGEMLTQLVPNIEKTALLVQEITSASNEQKTGVEQVNQAIQQLDIVIQQNVSIAEETAATASVLSEQAEHLQSVVAFFHITDTVEETDDQWRVLMNSMEAVQDHDLRAQIANAIQAIANRRAPDPSLQKKRADARPLEREIGGTQKNASEQSFVKDAPHADELDQEFEHY